jgi:hypothetical protein
MCDDGANGVDTDGCLDDCTIPPVNAPFCGDGNVDMDAGEECDDGANGDDTDGCLDDCTIPLPPLTECICSANGVYEPTTGVLNLEFNYCGQATPNEDDWIGIYPCDAPTQVATQEWWDDIVCPQLGATNADGSCQLPPSHLGFKIGEAYVDVEPTWFGYTCGPPAVGGCQATLGEAGLWPTEGRYTIDPNDPATAGANWAFLGGRSLEPGCYKAVLNRYMKAISPPPYPTTCAPWVDAVTFNVP